MKIIKTPVAIAILTAVTVIWGASFTLVRLLLDAGMTNGIINLMRGMGFAVLVFCFFGKKLFRMKWKESLIGLIAGSANSVAYLLQSAGIGRTTPSTSAFLTILSVIFVPLISLIVYRIKPSWRLLPAVALAVAGTFFLTGMSFRSFKIGVGEGMLIGCAFSFAISIAVLSNSGRDAAPYVTAFWMGVTQAAGGLLYFLMFERATASAIDWPLAWLPLAVLIIAGTFLSSSLQVVCQRSIEASTAAMIMTLEAVFGTAISLIAGFDRFSIRLLIGGGLIFSGVITVVAPRYADMKERWNNRHRRIVGEKQKDS
jgi:drug/metabolite transporter (DMT)-like permease